ncbi:glycosyltransferase [Shewanella maritima]|uniref:Glycosyltransferase n=1 Tax=Shewanella maritima TaxID=2520507 RepID=A0A411PEE1_9GAMM|nr:glycosyltransferase [Shewanella maritima]QBF81854.1 glycosyltransferase [Shewanella maritima]
MYKTLKAWANKLSFAVKLISYSRVKTLVRLLITESPGAVIARAKRFWQLKRYQKLGGTPPQSWNDSEDNVCPDLIVSDVSEFEVTLPLNIPTFDDIEVSIIVPVYNQWDYTVRCIHSIIENVEGVSFEVIVADDCSTDETINAQRHLPNAKIVRPEENQGFLKNCNFAAKHAVGDFIVLLNNDTVVHEHWLSSLLSTIKRDDDIGIVGSKLVYPDGTLQEAGGIVWRDGSAWNYGNGRNPSLPEYNYYKEVDYISGASVLIRATCWHQLEGFDTRYAPAYYEDTDFCFALRDLGYKTVFQPQSVVTHFEGKSHGTNTASGLKAYQVTNQKKFREKWHNILRTEHSANGQGGFVARDRSRNKKSILLIDHYVPWYDQDAGSRSTFMYVKFFVDAGYNVKFIGDNFYPHQPYTQVLESMGVEVLYGGHYAENWRGWFLEHQSFIDVVYFHRPHIAPKYLPFIKQHSAAKLVYQCHDLHHWRLARAAEISSCEKTKQEAQHWKGVELDIFDSVDVGLTFSHDEKAYLDALNLKSDIQQVPLFVYDKPSSPDSQLPFAKRQDLLFVGGFGHAPNEEGVLWFLESVWPFVQQRLPDICFHIVGSKMPDAIKAYGSDTVIIHGFVSDEELATLYRKVSVNILPLLHGAGVKGKLVESLFYGTPVVSTAIGLEGINAADYGLVASNTPQKFADQVAKLVMNEQDWQRQMSQQQQLFIDNFSRGAVAEHIKRVF